MRVLQVSAEFFPLLKTGGLADVAGALPLALAAAGQDVRVLLPGFPSILAGLSDITDVADIEAPWGQRARLRAGRIAAPGGKQVAAYVLDAPALYDRPGAPYEDASRQPYADNARRFALLGWAAARLARGLDPAWHRPTSRSTPRRVDRAGRALAASSPCTTWPTRACSHLPTLPGSACRPRPST